MEYYLIDEEDLSLTIIRRSALVVDEFDILLLEKGAKVKFLYPEGSQAATEYEGTIIAISKSETELVDIRKQEVRKFRKAMKVRTTEHTFKKPIEKFSAIENFG